MVFFIENSILPLSEFNIVNTNKNRWYLLQLIREITMEMHNYPVLTLRTSHFCNNMNNYNRVILINTGIFWLHIWYFEGIYFAYLLPTYKWHTYTIMINIGNVCHDTWPDKYRFDTCVLSYVVFRCVIIIVYSYLLSLTLQLVLIIFTCLSYMSGSLIVLSYATRPYYMSHLCFLPLS